MTTDEEQPLSVRVAAIEQLGRVTSELLRSKMTADEGTSRVIRTLCVLATGRPSAGERSEKSIDEWLRTKGYGMQEPDAPEPREAALAAIERGLANPDEPLELAVSAKGRAEIASLKAAPNSAQPCPESAPKGPKPNGNNSSQIRPFRPMAATRPPKGAPIEAATNTVGWWCVSHGIVGAERGGRGKGHTCSKCGAAVTWRAAQ